MSPLASYLSNIIQQFFGMYPGPSSKKLGAIVLFVTAGAGAMGAGFGFSAGLWDVGEFSRRVGFAGI